MLCEEGTIATKARSALLVPQSIKQVVLEKTQNNIRNFDKHCTNYGMTNHNVETCRKKKERTTMATTEGHNQVKNTKDIFIGMSHL